LRLIIIKIKKRKIMKKLLIYSLTAMVLASGCKKTGKTEDESTGRKDIGLNGLISESAVANITVNSTTVVGKPAQVQITGEFTSDGNAPLVGIENLSINGSDIPMIENNRYSKFYSAKDESFGQGLALFGREFTVTTSGYENGDVNTRLYSPGLITAKLNRSATALNRSLPLEITWNADPGNRNPVIILLVHRGLLDNPDALSISNITYMVKVDDNGRYSIPPTELSKFPVNSKLDILVSRGNQQILTVNGGKEVNVTAYTSELVPARIIK
jgi:hypothetical protein